MVILHEVVYTHIYGGVEDIIITLLQIVCKVWKWKNFENRSTNGENVDKSFWPMLYMYEGRSINKLQNCHFINFSNLKNPKYTFYGEFYS